MFGINKNSDTEAGVIVDIGSGSVGAAIVHTNNILNETNIVWTQRENILIKTTPTPITTENSIKTALVNIFLELGNAGVKTLSDFDKTAQIKNVMVSMAAPWSYVASKNVSLEDQKDFVVTEELLNELSKMANDEATHKVYENPTFTNFGIKIISQKNVAIRINGYKVKNGEYKNKKASEISFTHLTNLGTLEICDALDEVKGKIFPKAKLEVLPFIYVFYEILLAQYDNTLEGCLVDITNEATEFAIVRDGSLRTISHIPIGSSTLAREIAKELDIPSEQAFAYLRSNPEEDPNSLSAGQKKQLAKIIGSYQESVIKLFNDTGDGLAIPRSIFVHTDVNTGDFFNFVIKSSANLTTNNTHTIHPLTEKIISESHTGDTAILASVKYYTLRQS